MASKPPRFVQDCNCGGCPRWPTGRPPTRRECIAWWRHRYTGFWSEERILVEAIGSYVHHYRRYVNDQGWRKPPDWDGERHVPLSELRPARAMLMDEAKAWERKLLARMRRRLADEVAA